MIASHYILSFCIYSHYILFLFIASLLSFFHSYSNIYIVFYLFHRFVIIFPFVYSFSFYSHFFRTLFLSIFFSLVPFLYIQIVFFSPLYLPVIPSCTHRIFTHVIQPAPNSFTQTSPKNLKRKINLFHPKQCGSAFVCQGLLGVDENKDTLVRRLDNKRIR